MKCTITLSTLVLGVALLPSVVLAVASDQADASLARPSAVSGQSATARAAESSPSQLPAPAGSPRFTVAGRNRVELRIGVSHLSPSLGASASRDGLATGLRANLGTGILYTRFVSEDLAVTLAAHVSTAEFAAAVGQPAFDVSDALRFAAGPGEAGGNLSRYTFAAAARTIVALPFGVRWYPLGHQLSTSPVKPYVTTGVGPVVGSRSDASLRAGRARGDSATEVVIGGYLGTGLDLHVTRFLSFGVGGGYRWMADFSQQVGGRNNHSGFDVGLSVGWLFGRRSAAND